MAPTFLAWIVVYILAKTHGNSRKNGFGEENSGFLPGTCLQYLRDIYMEISSRDLDKWDWGSKEKSTWKR